jgi:hypothetical protein
LTTRYIAESQWRVELQTGAPSLQSLEKVLYAPSQEIAIHRAVTSYPNMQFIRTTATQLDPQSGGASQQNASTPTATGMMPGFKPMQQPRGLAPLWPQNQQGQPQPAAESRLPVDPRWFTYPYSISLPDRFSKVLHETAPNPVIKHGGQHAIVLETIMDMRFFLTRLQGHHDRYATKMIFDGIRSSLG